MPGDQSRSNPGQKGNTPYVPSWMEPLQDERPIFECPKCGADLAAVETPHKCVDGPITRDLS
jgi:hypothetical protein